MFFMKHIIENGIHGSISYGSDTMCTNTIYDSLSDIKLRILIFDKLVSPKYIRDSIKQKYLQYNPPPSAVKFRYKNILGAHCSLTKKGFETFKEMFQNRDVFEFIS